MRMLVEIDMPLEPFNSYVRDGSAGARIGKIMEAIKPEAIYFTAQRGNRGGVMIVNVESASDIPSIAEPFFLVFEAEVAFHPCMSPQDLANSGLEALGEKWA